MTELHGRVAVVTGAASGIGRTLAQHLYAAGAKVALADIDREAVRATAACFDDPDSVLAVPSDVTSLADYAILRDTVARRLGAADIVCLNAGIVASGPLLDTSMDMWRRLLEVNVLGVVNGITTFVPDLVARRRGHIVITASAAGLMNAPGLGAYSVSKHATVGLAANLHDELAGTGVGVTVLCPGVIRTPLFDDGRGSRHDVHPDEQTVGMYRQLAAAAPGPDIVARDAVAAIGSSRLWVLTSPEVGGLLLRRLDSVRAALPPRP